MKGELHWVFYKYFRQHDSRQWIIIYCTICYKTAVDTDRLADWKCAWIILSNTKIQYCKIFNVKVFLVFMLKKKGCNICVLILVLHLPVRKFLHFLIPSFHIWKNELEMGPCHSLILINKWIIYIGWRVPTTL